MTTDNFTAAAQIIDEHRVVSTAFGSTREGRGGRWATCLCGNEVKSFYDEQAAPIDSENNPERDVQRKHAMHVADMLARDDRRDEERRASCGCDLTGPVPPAVHIVDQHEEKR